MAACHASWERADRRTPRWFRTRWESCCKTSRRARVGISSPRPEIESIGAPVRDGLVAVIGPSIQRFREQVAISQPRERALECRPVIVLRNRLALRVVRLHVVLQLPRLLA